MGATAIQWTDVTWNPVTGCRKVSAGCTNCYAERLAPRVFAGQTVDEGPVSDLNPDAPHVQRPRRFTDVRTHPERLDAPLRWRKPRRVFVNSMSDLFHEDVPDEFIGAVFSTMARAPQHTFQVLTKRPERMRRILLHWMRGVERTHDPRHGVDALPPCAVELPLQNVWLGVSVEDQAAADARVPVLLDTPAAVRFLSCEPLLGPVDLSAWLPYIVMRRSEAEQMTPEIVAAMHEVARATWRSLGEPTVDWIIVGGESGPKARPMDLAWARSLVEQGRAAGVPVFVKQLGRRPYVSPESDGATGYDLALRDSHGGDPEEWPADLRVREFPAASAADYLRANTAAVEANTDQLDQSFGGSL